MWFKGQTSPDQILPVLIDPRHYSACGKFSIGDLQSLGCSASAMFRVGDIQPLRYSASGTPWIGAVIFRFENISLRASLVPPQGSGPPYRHPQQVWAHELRASPMLGAPRSISTSPRSTPRLWASKVHVGIPPQKVWATPLNHTSPSSGHPMAPPHEKYS